MRSKTKLIAYSLLSLFLGIGCLYLVIDFAPITIQDIYFQFKQIKLIYIILIIIITFINNNLIAYKWKQVIYYLSKKPTKTQIFYLFYIVFGALVGIIIPRQVSMLTVQSLATNFHKVGNLTNGFMGAIYNQLLNLIVPIILLPTTILFALEYISLPVTIFLALFSLCMGAYLFSQWQKIIVLFFMKIYFKLKNKPQIEQQKFLQDIPLIKPNFTIHLYWITVLFHTLGALRNCLIILAAGLNIKLSIVALATPLIYLAMLLSITPGNLGIMEWSWIGILDYYNVAAQDAASFAILQRILITIAIIAIFICLSFTVATRFYLTKKSYQ